MKKGRFFLKRILRNNTSFQSSLVLKVLTFLGIYLSLCLPLRGQEVLLTLEQKSTYFTTDDLRNLYVINDLEEIVKYNPDGKETYRYSNTRLDRPALIDATDPFNVLVFYPDYQTIILLDRTMTETAVLNLADFGFFNINTVGMSSDNKIWLYDELNFRLKKVDRNGKTTQESDDLSLLLNADINPDFITEREQTVFVNIPDVGILVFDFFGQYIKMLDFKNLREFQILKDRMLFQERGKLQSFHLKTLLTNAVPLPTNYSDFEKIQVRQARLYFSDTQGIKMLEVEY